MLHHWERLLGEAFKIIPMILDLKVYLCPCPRGKGLVSGGLSPYHLLGECLLSTRADISQVECAVLACDRDHAPISPSLVLLKFDIEIYVLAMLKHA